MNVHLLLEPPFLVQHVGDKVTVGVRPLIFAPVPSALGKFKFILLGDLLDHGTISKGAPSICIYQFTSSSYNILNFIAILSPIL